MHSMESQQGSIPGAATSRGGVYKDVGGSKEMLIHYSAGCAAGVLGSPRGATQQCKYKSGKCSNPRATKRNGQLHTLCHFHRVRQNEHQRKSDRKHRMVSVARRAKLGNMGLLTTPPHKHGGRRSISSNASDVSSDAPSTPASPMDIDRSYEQQGDGAYLNPFHLQSLSRVHHMGDAGYASPSGAVGTPTGRLPPISFLTQPGKLDSFRASSSSSGLTLPPPSSFLQGSSSLNAQAGKSA